MFRPWVRRVVATIDLLPAIVGLKFDSVCNGLSESDDMVELDDLVRFEDIVESHPRERADWASTLFEEDVCTATVTATIHRHNKFNTTTILTIEQYEVRSRGNQGRAYIEDFSRERDE